MAAPLKKLSLNVSDEIHDMIRTRMSELPYKSESDFLLALCLHNCRFRATRPHTFSAPVLNQRADMRAKHLERIVSEFHDGLEPTEEVPIEQAMAEMVVERLLRIPARVRTIKGGSRTRRR